MKHPKQPPARTARAASGASESEHDGKAAGNADDVTNHGASDARALANGAGPAGVAVPAQAPDVASGTAALPGKLRHWRGLLPLAASAVGIAILLTLVLRGGPKQHAEDDWIRNKYTAKVTYDEKATRRDPNFDHARLRELFPEVHAKPDTERKQRATTHRATTPAGEADEKSTNGEAHSAAAASPPATEND